MYTDRVAFDLGKNKENFAKDLRAKSVTLKDSLKQN